MVEDSPENASTIPSDDPNRTITVARPDTDESLPHLGLVGDTYTILIGGQDTAGKYTLIDMHVPPGGGPPPHRHDFEEMFTVLEGELEVTFRGDTMTARAGETINVPANAPHAFRNPGDGPTRLLCMCAPAGQDAFFAAVGEPVATRTEPPPRLDEAAQQTFIAKSMALAAQYRTELLLPPQLIDRELASMPPRNNECQAGTMQRTRPDPDAGGRAVLPDQRRDARRNRARLLEAATTAVHREGRHVPMATIAAEAGVGVGTLYRHFSTRTALLDALTRRSFEQVLKNARAADAQKGSAIDALAAFLDAAISQRHELILPLHGGPAITTAKTAAIRRQVHSVIQRILDRGVAEGTIRPDAMPSDIVIFGALLAQPLPSLRKWDQTCRRLRQIYLEGLATRATP